jgi:hypothetical protein
MARVIVKLDTCTGVNVKQGRGNDLNVELGFSTPGDARRAARLIDAAADKAEIQFDTRRTA